MKRIGNFAKENKTFSAIVLLICTTVTAIFSTVVPSNEDSKSSKDNLWQSPLTILIQQMYQDQNRRDKLIQEVLDQKEIKVTPTVLEKLELNQLKKIHLVSK